MIIDFHTQIWSNLDQLGPTIARRLRSRQAEHWGQFDASPAAHERAMTCVDAAAVLGFRASRLEALIPTALVADVISKDPQRRLGIAGIDPLHPDAAAHLDEAVELGMIGITVSPALAGFHPSHSAAMRVYDRCAEMGLPVFVTHHLPLPPIAELEFARPLLWDEVARDLPNLQLVIGQLGDPWINETLALLAKHDHISADLSAIAGNPWRLYNALQAAHSRGVMGRLLFGSGFPLETPAKVIETLYSLYAFASGSNLPSIPRELIRSVIERDTLEHLGIERELITVGGGTRSREADSVESSLLPLHETSA